MDGETNTHAGNAAHARAYDALSASAEAEAGRARAREASLGARSGALLFLAGATALLASAPFRDPGPGVARLLAVLLVGAAGATALWLIDRRGRATHDLVCGFTCFGVATIALVVAASGGVDSPYPVLYVLAVAHAAAFQQRRCLYAVMALSGVLFASPALYDRAASGFIVEVLVFGATTVIAALVLHHPIERLRDQYERLVEREREALALAQQDPLTGVGNYRRFRQQLDVEVARARRYQEAFSLVLLDLNGFKALNDEYGHDAGDAALRRVAHALGGALRAEDVLCRQGGDEFAAIAVQAGSIEGRELAGRLVDAVAAAGEAPDMPGNLTACAGWATFGEHGQTTDELVALADEALRTAKRSALPVVGAGDALAPVRTTAPGPGAVPRDITGRLAALVEFARALARGSSERAISELAVAHLAGVVEADVTAVVRETVAREVRPIAFTGAGELVAGLVGHPLLEEVVFEGWTHDAGDLGGKRANELRALLAVPVRVGDRALWGALMAGSLAAQAFDRADREMIEAMAAQVGRALRCARAFPVLAAASLEELDAAAGELDSHSRRLARLALGAAQALGAPAEARRSICLGVVLYEGGLVEMPNGLLLKPGHRTDDEFALVRDHRSTATGGRPAELGDAARIAGHGQERYDGTGPAGLARQEIPLGSRIAAAVVAHVSATSQKPYRPALRPDQAREELERVAGSQLDPVVVKALLVVVRRESVTPPPARR